MDFKKNWGSLTEEEPALGLINMFQTSPSVEPVVGSTYRRRLHEGLTAKSTAQP